MKAAMRREGTGHGPVAQAVLTALGEGWVAPDREEQMADVKPHPAAAEEVMGHHREGNRAAVPPPQVPRNQVRRNQMAPAEIAAAETVGAALLVQHKNSPIKLKISSTASPSASARF